MMKKLYIAMFTFCVLAITALFFLPNSQNPTREPILSSSASAMVQNTATPLQNTFLWKVEKAGEPTSYLLGTLHLGKLNAKLPTPIMTAFHQTTAVVTEANMIPESQEIFEIGMLMMDMQGSLSKKLGQTRFNQLGDLVEPLVPKSALDKMRPWAALTLIIYNKPEGYSEQFGIDMLLTQQAIEYGKRRVFLESIQDGLQVFAGLPEDKVISLIGVTIDHLSEARQETKALIDLYENNQLNAVITLLADNDKMLKYYPPKDREFWDRWLRQDLLVKRNDKWQVILKKQLASEPTLVAVGALHLVGDNGMIEQFRQMGYKVTPVMPN